MWLLNERCDKTGYNVKGHVFKSCKNTSVMTWKESANPVRHPACQWLQLTTEVRRVGVMLCVTKRDTFSTISFLILSTDKWYNSWGWSFQCHANVHVVVLHPVTACKKNKEQLVHIFNISYIHRMLCSNITCDVFLVSRRGSFCDSFTMIGCPKILKMSTCNLCVLLRHVYRTGAACVGLHDILSMHQTLCSNLTWCTVWSESQKYAPYLHFRWNA
jgi:hypothetical protein